MPANAQANGGLRLRSIFIKATAIAGLCALLLTAAAIWRDHQGALRNAHSGLFNKATFFSQLVGAGLQDSLTTSDAPQAEAGLQHAMDLAGTELRQLQLYRADGTLLASRLAAGERLAPPPQLALDAQSRFTDPQITTGPDGLIASHIITQYGQRMGTLVSHWSNTALLNSANTAFQQSAMIAAGLFVLMLLATALIYRIVLARPLTHLNQAITKVASGDYSSTIPGQGAKDEFGTIALALDQFRAALADAESTRLEGLLKGSGFQSTSAALMITDAQARILYCNPAADRLLQAALPHLHGQALIGAQLTSLDPALDAVASQIRAGYNRMLSLTIGHETMAVSVGRIGDGINKCSGYVLEWRNTTQDQRNAAILLALDTAHIRAEFDQSGRILEANQHMLSLTVQNRNTQPDLKKTLQFCDPAAGDFWAHTRSTAPFAALLRLRLEPDIDALLDAHLCPIKDDTGAVRSVLMLATNVTRQEQARHETEALRQNMESAQNDVVNGLTAALARLSEGDLEANLPQTFAPQYEALRRDFNATAQNLRIAINEVLEAASTIQGEVGDLASAADNLSRRTEQQAATLEQTAAALDQMTGTVQTTAGVAAQANTMVTQARQNAENSGKVVQEAVTAMGEIAESSSRISRITSVIDEIAFQTNLLALNAGVEAARAGEAGRGFAVVASEVRDLAQRSSEAAREIATLIADSSEQVRRGVGLVGEAGRSLSGIQQSVGEIHGLVGTIAEAAQEQSSGIAELNTAVKHLDQVTQQNAAMFEQTAAASQSLGKAVTSLNLATDRFSISPQNAPKKSAASTTTLAWGIPDNKRPVRVPPAKSHSVKSQPIKSPSPPSATPKRARATAMSNTINEQDWEDF